MNCTITVVLLISLSTLNLTHLLGQIVKAETSPLFVLSTMDTSEDSDDGCDVVNPA